MSKIVVLRLGHRIHRDIRITTHVALTARAFGADKIVISGYRDEKLIERLNKILEKWGGDFSIEYEEDWRRLMRRWREGGGKIVHLTMYGVNLPDIVEELRRCWERNDVMIVVGSEKVPREVYILADYNVAVSNQPHSEVAAIAVLLDWLYQGRELSKEFPNAKLKIIPQPCGKKVIKLK